jgi:hypothetical protein
MGFDPRRWSSPPRQPRPVTSNLEGLLAENQALRQEVQQLRRRLAQLERLDRHPRSAGPTGAETQAPPRVTAEQVRRWGERLARQSGWTELRSGGDDSGLRGLIEALNRGSFHPHLTLEQRLDRLAPGLGADLQQALAGPLTKKRLAVLAAFGLYGISASEWLEDDPARVVADLRQRIVKAAAPARISAVQIARLTNTPPLIRLRLMRIPACWRLCRCLGSARGHHARQSRMRTAGW